MAQTHNPIWRAATLCITALVGTAAGSGLSPTTTRAADCEDDYCDTFWVDECTDYKDIHMNCNYKEAGGCEHTVCS